MYPALKHLHIACAGISFGLFVLRGWWMINDAARLRQRWVRIVPHVVDTVLLASAIGLTVIIQQWPLRHAWLTAKVIGLLVYIVLGTIALGRGPTRTIRIGAFFGALAVFGWIVVTARLHTPWLPMI